MILYYYRGRYEDSISTLDKVLDNFRDRLGSVEIASCYLFKGDDYAIMAEIAKEDNIEKSNTLYDLAKDSYFQAIKKSFAYKNEAIILEVTIRNEHTKTRKIL